MVFFKEPAPISYTNSESEKRIASFALAKLEIEKKRMVIRKYKRIRQIVISDVPSVIFF